MNTKRFLLFVLLAIALSACAATRAAPSEPAATPAGVVPPEQVVEDFYGWYLGYVGDPTNPRNPLVDGAYQSSEYLTPDFIAQVDAIVASFDTGGYDPFLCSQDVPESVTVEKVAPSGDEATVTVRTSFPGHTFTLQLKHIDGQWKIAGIVCSAKAGSELDDWPLFTDDVYGYQMRIPPMWQAEEVPILQPDLEEPVVRVIAVAPPDWAEDYKPYLLEVSVGSAEAYTRRFPLPEEGERQTINGYAVSVATFGPPDSAVVFYMFQHTTDATLRVTVRDEVSGFPARAAGNNILSSVLSRMLSTFEFTR